MFLVLALRSWNGVGGLWGIPHFSKVGLGSRFEIDKVGPISLDHEYAP